MVTNLALVLHEMTTNAVKYGALSSPAGHVDVSWSVENDSLSLIWKEHGGPALAGAPEKDGFGSALMRQMIVNQLEGDIPHHWYPEGLTVHLTISSPHKS